MMELLAPAGSFECAKAAVAAGADAIYMGGPLFSARAYAESSADGGNKKEEDQLSLALRYCHLHGVKVYMTVNTLMKDAELTEIDAYLEPYVNLHVDAFIVQDLGLMAHLKERFPRVPLHVSTQAFVTGPRYARRLLSLGAKRVVPARELSLCELSEIAAAGIEVEAFVHGALCYCYSGQCLMSSFLGGRSGNRGRCAGPCRLPYEVYDENLKRVGEEDEKLPMSLKDLCTLSRLSDLRKAGVCSLKIEGRMKSPLYVAGVVSVYRKWLDHPDLPEEERVKDEQKLREIFDRGGFTCAYLDKHNGRDMLTLFEKEARVPDRKVVEEITEKYLTGKCRIPIRGKAFLVSGNEAEFTITEEKSGVSVTVKGPVVEAASSRAVTEADIREKLEAFGNTEFELTGLLVTAEEGIFIPVSALKKMRQTATMELTGKLTGEENET